MAMLSRGSRGEAVRKLQEALSRASIPVSVDGIFGPKTEKSLIAFQVKYGLPANGVYTPETAEKLTEKSIESLDTAIRNCLAAIEKLPEFKRLVQLL